ncbi:MAG: antibiotic biosynthesis monooxygenase [Rhodobacter sp.]|nr:antibiotic biosynthesis monooxygenase [Rhodobacter sp.]
MIRRIWRAWASKQNAGPYETLLRDEVFVNIRNKAVPGLRDAQLCRRDVADEVEFVVLMTFESIEAVKALVGDTYEVAYVPEKARALLSRFDDRALHYEVRVVLDE